MPARQNWFEGWRRFAVLTLILIGLSVWIAGMRQFEVDGVRMVIRFTARTSPLFFCLAFSAAALARLWPNAWTRWQRRNRRYLGVSFAASHGIHALAILTFAQMDPTGRRHVGGILCVRRHRLRLHYRDDGDLVRPQRSPRSARAPFAPCI